MVCLALCPGTTPPDPFASLLAPCHSLLYAAGGGADVGGQLPEHAAGATGAGVRAAHPCAAGPWVCQQWRMAKEV